MGVVFDLIHSFPYINDNQMGFLLEVLEKSYLTLLDNPVDLNHDRNIIIGNIVKVDLMKEENKPAVVRVAAVLYKDILENYWIKNLEDLGWSMSCYFNDYAFAINGKVYKKEKFPEFMERLNDWKEGIPVYDSTGNRVSLLLGGIDGEVEFNGCGLIEWGSPADKFANTLLQVAKKNGVDNMPKTYTEEEFKMEVKNAVASAKEEVKNEFESKLNQVKADLAAKEEEIANLKAENESFKTQLTAANEKISEYVVKDRKAVLASKGYPGDLIVQKEEFLKKATDEEFNNFITEFEALANALKSTQTQNAVANTVSSGFGHMFINLTNDNSGDANQDTTNIFI